MNLTETTGLLLAAQTAPHVAEIAKMAVDGFLVTPVEVTTLKTHADEGTLRRFLVQRAQERINMLNRAKSPMEVLAFDVAARIRGQATSSTPEEAARHVRLAMLSAIETAARKLEAQATELDESRTGVSGDDAARMVTKAVDLRIAARTLRFMKDTQLG